MKCTLSDLKRKEVVETKTGAMLGRVDDIEINVDSSSVETLIIFGRPKLLGILGRESDIIIKYNDIDLIGRDTVLVTSSGIKEHKQQVLEQSDSLFRRKKDDSDEIDAFFK